MVVVRTGDQQTQIVFRPDNPACLRRFAPRSAGLGAEVCAVAMMKRERWKPVIGFEKYEVSDSGRVRRAAPGRATYKGRVLKPEDRRGYARVSFRVHGRLYRFSIHRLVLEAFRGPCPTGMQAAHMNGHRSDNRLSNLSWVTQGENERHKVAHGTTARGERNANSRLTERDVLAMRADYGRVGSRSLARRYGIAQSTVRDVVSRRRWRHI